MRATLLFAALFLAQAAPAAAESPIDLPAGSKALDCSRAPEKIDRLEASILDVKARYWARELKQGKALSQALANPGSTITSPALKSEFFRLVRLHYREPGVPHLSMQEDLLRDTTEDLVFRLYTDCRVAFTERGLTPAGVRPRAVSQRRS